MKNLFLSFLTVALIPFFSCKEKCEKENTSDITITNNTKTSLWFDVTNSGGRIYDIRQVPSGTSTKYTIPPKDVIVWGSYNSNRANFIPLDSMTLIQCGSESYATESQSCAIFNLTNVTMVNKTGRLITINVFVLGYDSFLGEHYLGNGESFTYFNVPATAVYFWIKFSTSWYSTTSYFPLNTCKLFTFDVEFEKNMRDFNWQQESKAKYEELFGMFSSK
jgi:ribosomal protein L37E